MILRFPKAGEPTIDEDLSEALFEDANDFHQDAVCDMGIKEGIVLVYHLFLDYRGTSKSYILAEDDNGWYEPIEYSTEENANADWRKVICAKWGNPDRDE